MGEVEGHAARRSTPRVQRRPPPAGPPSWPTIAIPSVLSLVIGLLLAVSAQQILFASRSVTRDELRIELTRHNEQQALEESEERGEIALIRRRQDGVLQTLAGNREILNDLKRRIAALERRPR